MFNSSKLSTTYARCSLACNWIRSAIRARSERNHWKLGDAAPVLHYGIWLSPIWTLHRWLPEGQSASRSMKNRSHPHVVSGTHSGVKAHYCMTSLVVYWEHSGDDSSKYSNRYLLAWQVLIKWTVQPILADGSEEERVSRKKKRKTETTGYIWLELICSILRSVSTYCDTAELLIHSSWITPSVRLYIWLTQGLEGV